MDIIECLKLGYDKGASDLHISCGQAPTIRHNGELKPLSKDIIDSSTIDKFEAHYLSPQVRDILDKKGDIDFSFSLDFCRLRVNIFQQREGHSIAFRYIPSEILSLETINAPQITKEFCQERKGLVLVTGPTGSGKTTTLASMVDYINLHLAYHIITIEDPIEFIHKSKRSLIHQREVYKDCVDFNQALKASLREDPDVILIGELRDVETIRLALTAAETGHLVFATLHTNSAVKTIDRIVDVFPENEKNLVRIMLAESLVGVIAQVLLPHKHLDGRVGAFEVLAATPAVRNLVRENKLSQILSVMQTSQASGMQTFDKVIQELVQKDLVDKEIASHYVYDKSALL